MDPDNTNNTRSRLLRLASFALAVLISCSIAITIDPGVASAKPADDNGAVNPSTGGTNQNPGANGTTETPAGGSGNMTANLEKLTGGLAWYALMACVAGILISSSLWALGSKGQNPGQELTGKKGLIVCCTAAFMVGALQPTIDFYTNLAKQNDSAGVMTGITP